VTAKWCYLVAVFTGLFVVILYNLLIRFFAKLLIWLSVIGTGIGIGVLAYFLNHYHTQNFADKEDSTAGDVLKVAVYILYGLTGLYFLIVLCLCKDIAVSIAVLKTSAIIILGNLRILIVPSIAIIVICGFIFGWGVGLCFLLSRANIHLPSEENDTFFKEIDFVGKEFLKW